LEAGPAGAAASSSEPVQNHESTGVDFTGKVFEVIGYKVAAFERQMLAAQAT
jgi:hypothetical protein